MAARLSSCSLIAEATTQPEGGNPHDTEPAHRTTPTPAAEDGCGTDRIADGQPCIRIPLDWIAEKAAANRKKLYEAMPDKALVDAFYVMPDDGKKESPTSALVQAGYRLKSVNLAC